MASLLTANGLSLLDTSGRDFDPFQSMTRSSTSSTLSDSSTLIDSLDYSEDTSCLNCSTLTPSTDLTKSTPAVVSDTPPNLAVKGKNLPIAPLTQSIKGFLQSQLASLDRPLCIVGLLATVDEGCALYANQTRKSCAENGVHFDLRDITACQALGGGFDDIKRAIEEVNLDKAVDGLIVYFPLFSLEKDNELRAMIAPRIDVEGIHPSSLAESSIIPPPLLSEIPDLLRDAAVSPCTSLAVVQALQSVAGLYNPSAKRGQRLEDKTITIVNRSETVGRPLANMLASESALVYSVDIADIHTLRRPSPLGPTCEAFFSSTDPTTLSALFAKSDIVVSAVPSASYTIPTEDLKVGAVCINLSHGNNFDEDVKDRAAFFARRVGGVTLLMLQLNALILRLRGC